MYIFICIGTSKITGDSLGPMIGTYLKHKYRKNNNVKIYGDLDNQVDYNNVDKILNEIEKKYYKSCIKIIIDSALGKKVGTYIVSENDIGLGKGLSKSKIINGDINIIAVVGKNYGNNVRNMIELKSIKEEKIKQMAIEVTKAIDV